MNTDLRNLIMEECLALSNQALAIFDAIEAGPITLDLARTLVEMGDKANGIFLGVRMLAMTRG